jgi:hypothetical protein
MKPAVEIAEAMYQASREDSKPKMPETLFDCAPHTQQRYLFLAESVIAFLGDTMTLAELVDDYAEGTLCTAAADTIRSLVAEKSGSPAVHPPMYPAELLNRLAEHLAWKLLNPQQFTDGVRAVFTKYAEEVGEENVPEIVKKAMEI